MGNPQIVLTMKAYELLSNLKVVKGEVIELIIDDSKKQKRGKAMEAVGWIRDRWSIEVFFKDSKQLLGLCQYQNYSYEAAVTQLHQVCFAYALLTHVAIISESAQGKAAVDLSSSELQNEVCRIAWDYLTDYLNQLSSGIQIVKELERLLIAA
jgi:hypothetical protein